jgi:hypothetical protein
MIQKEFRDFIEQNCSGIEPSDLIMEAINGKIELYQADADEVLAFVEECIKGPTLEQKAEIARRAAEAEAERQARIAEAKAKAESDAKNAAMAAEKAKHAMAEAELARQKADEAKAKLQSDRDAQMIKKSNKRTFITALIVVLLLGGAGTAAYLALSNRKSVAQLASEAVYNTINSTSIDDIEINTEDVPSADPSVVIDPTKDVKVQLEQYYETVLDLDAGFYKIINNNKVGLADPSGKIIQKPRYDAIMAKNEQGLIRVVSDEKMGFLNLKGVEVVPPTYTNIENPKDGLIKVKKGDKYGFINATTLKEVTPCEYTYIYPLRDGKYKVMKGSLSGYLNADGSLAQELQ